MCQSGKDKVFLLPAAVFRAVGEGRRKGKRERVLSSSLSWVSANAAPSATAGFIFNCLTHSLSDD